MKYLGLYEVRKTKISFPPVGNRYTIRQIPSFTYCSGSKQTILLCIESLAHSAFTGSPNGIDHVSRCRWKYPDAWAFSALSSKSRISAHHAWEKHSAKDCERSNEGKTHSIDCRPDCAIACPDGANPAGSGKVKMERLRGRIPCLHWFVTAQLQAPLLAHPVNSHVPAAKQWK